MTDKILEKLDVMEAINVLQDKLELSTSKAAIERAFNIALALADEVDEAGRVLLINGDGSCVQLQIKGESK